MIRKYRPYLDLSDILAALRPGTGRNEFESAVAARVGARYAVAFAYGHSGAIASLKALGVTEAEVILPAYTCTVMADSVVASGNRPVFVDIDLADYNMGLDAMKATLTLQTRAIVATHMYGYPTNVDAIREAVGDERVLIIEDRALGLLTSTLGTTDLRGDIGLFSFGPNKHLFTVQGGVIATNSIDLYEKIKACRDREMDHLPAAVWIKRWMRLLFSYLPFGDSISLHGLLNKIQNTTAPNRSPSHFNPTPTLVARDYATAYTAFQARVGLSQLRKLDVILDRRQTLAKFYDRELRDVPGLTPAPIIPGATYSHYTVRIRRRDKIGFSQHMRNRGVEVGQMYDRVLPFRKRFRPYAKDKYPNTEQATRQVVNLPNYPNLTMAEAQHIAKCTRHILQKFGQCLGGSNELVYT